MNRFTMPHDPEEAFLPDEILAILTDDVILTRDLSEPWRAYINVWNPDTEIWDTHGNPRLDTLADAATKIFTAFIESVR